MINISQYCKEMKNHAIALDVAKSQMKEYLENSSQNLVDYINKKDAKFIFKLRKFPGDITFVRLAKISQHILDYQQSK